MDRRRHRWFVGGLLIALSAVSLALLSGCGILGSAARPPELVDTPAAYEQAVAQGGDQAAKYKALLTELKVFRARAAIAATLTPDAPVKKPGADGEGAAIGRYGTWFVDAAEGPGFLLRAVAYKATEHSSVVKIKDTSWSSVPLLRASGVRVRMDVERQKQSVDLCLFSSSDSECKDGYRVTIGTGGYKIAAPSRALCSLKPAKDGSSIHRQRQLYVGPGNRAYPYTRLEVDAMHGYLRVSLNGTEICAEAASDIGGDHAGYFLVNAAVYTLDFPRGTERVLVADDEIVSVTISPDFPKAEIGGEAYKVHDALVRDVTRLGAGERDGFENSFFGALRARVSLP